MKLFILEKYLMNLHRLDFSRLMLFFSHMHSKVFIISPASLSSFRKVTRYRKKGLFTQAYPNQAISWGENEREK
jgi:hypothetical protein